MNESEFKIYHISRAKKRLYTSERLVSIPNLISIYFNPTFMNEIEISNIYCNLYFNKKENKIGFIFKTKEDRNEDCLSVRIYKSKVSRTGTVSGCGFFRSINVSLSDVVGKYTPQKEIVDGQEMWVIDLNEKL